MCGQNDPIADEPCVRFILFSATCTETMPLFAGSFIKEKFSVDTKQSDGKHSGKEMGDSLTSTMQFETSARELPLPARSLGRLH